ncbi:unnamed protein product [Rodentolepis nana]|uniref:Uncharacterized protein n=1 Tax=Rodentolepis nana TaxID=102285 RepID=A0A158QH42_RODNA|nr:unnamed protein product [Rodentolepis nana]
MALISARFTFPNPNRTPFFFPTLKAFLRVEIYNKWLDKIVTRRLSLSQDAEALLSVSTITTAASTESRGVSEESLDVVHAIGETEGRFARQRQPSATILILLARFKWDFPDTRSLSSSASTLPRTGKPTTPLVVPCNGELEDFQAFSSSAPVVPNSTADSWTPSSSVVSLNPPLRTNAPLPPTYIQRTPSPISLDSNIALIDSLCNTCFRLFSCQLVNLAGALRHVKHTWCPASFSSITLCRPTLGKKAHAPKGCDNGYIV